MSMTNLTSSFLSDLLELIHFAVTDTVFVTWSNKKASMLFFLYRAWTQAMREKISFNFHGRYITSMTILIFDSYPFPRKNVK